MKFPLSSHPAALAHSEGSLTTFLSKDCAYISNFPGSNKQTLNGKLKFRYNPRIEKKEPRNRVTPPVSLKFFFHFERCIKEVIKENKKDSNPELRSCLNHQAYRKRILKGKKWVSLYFSVFSLSPPLFRCIGTIRALIIGF